MLSLDLHGLVMSQTVSGQPDRSIAALACLLRAWHGGQPLCATISDRLHTCREGGRKRLCGLAAVLRSLRPATSSETIQGPSRELQRDAGRR